MADPHPHPPPHPHCHPPWSDLHADVLRLISQKLTLIFDYISFRSVCRSWRTAADPLGLPPQTPILTFPYDPGNYEDHIRKIFFLDTRRVCNLNVPEARNKRCLASDHGLFLVLGSDPSIFLLNPFTGAQILLPPFTTLPGVLGFDPEEEEYTCDFGYRSGTCCCDGAELCEEMVLQAAISSNPSCGGSDGCAVMLTLSENTKLAFCRPGDISWTGIDTGSRNTFRALTCYNGKFYAVDWGGNVAVCDVSVSPPRVEAIPSLKRNWDEQSYLVGSAVGLFFVQRYKEKGDDNDDDDDDDDDEGGEEFFDVFKMMDAHGAAPGWGKIGGSLDGETLFLCGSHGYSVRARDCPGVEPDCIYCSDALDENTIYDEGHCVTVFRMEDASIRLIECYRDNNLCWWTAAWLRPSV